MSAKPYDPNYPVEIDLTREVPDYGNSLAVGPSKGGDKKTKQVGASLYLRGGKELASIPKSGYALIEFKRVSATIRDGKSAGPNGDYPASVELEVSNICLPKKSGGKDMASDFAAFAKSQGVDTEGMGDDESAEETPDDEKAEGEERAT